jgi:hypothetical protein
MFGAIREYTIRPGTIDELIGKIRTDFVPIVAAVPGLVSYTVVVDGADGLITTSIFDSEDGAQESVKLAGAWVAETLQTFVSAPARVTTGEITVRHVNENVPAAFGVMRRFSCTSENARTISARVRDELVPTMSARPGLASFGLLVESGADRGGATLSAYVDRATAETANAESLAWVNENVGDLLTGPREIVMGEIKLRHTRAAVGAG